ncbi:hypothetical protein [Nitratidesulfovibrio sp. 1201_IL3209]|uniref:hypothetical protein n=1 Tax=Nitratidesulfovibrio sp. 1201_IL3209 TaxID=3084053 RepID=UPI002FD9E3BD
MFDNATMFMMFILLCFAGLLVMFYFVLRGMDELARGMRDEHAALASGLRTLEARVNELARAQRAAAAGLPATPGADAGADVFDEPAGQYHVQYGTGPDARTDVGYGAGYGKDADPLYGLVQEDGDSTLPGGLAMDFEEPVELVDRSQAGVPGFRQDGVPGFGQDGVSGFGQDGGYATAQPHAAPREAVMHEVELPSLDLGGPASGAPRGRGAGLDTSGLDTSAFGGPSREPDDNRETQPDGAAGPDLLSFGDDRSDRSDRSHRSDWAAHREAHERGGDARERGADDRAGRGLPDLKLDD